MIICNESCLLISPDIINDIRSMILLLSCLIQTVPNCKLFNDPSTIYMYMYIVILVRPENLELHNIHWNVFNILSCAENHSSKILNVTYLLLLSWIADNIVGWTQRNGCWIKYLWFLFPVSGFASESRLLRTQSNKTRALTDGSWVLLQGERKSQTSVFLIGHSRIYSL